MGYRSLFFPLERNTIGYDMHHDVSSDHWPSMENNSYTYKECIYWAFYLIYAPLFKACSISYLNGIVFALCVIIQKLSRLLSSTLMQNNQDWWRTKAILTNNIIHMCITSPPKQQPKSKNCTNAIIPRLTSIAWDSWTYWIGFFLLFSFSRCIYWVLHDS